MNKYEYENFISIERDKGVATYNICTAFISISTFSLQDMLQLEVSLSKCCNLQCQFEKYSPMKFIM